MHTTRLCLLIGLAVSSLTRAALSDEPPRPAENAQTKQFSHDGVWKPTSAVLNGAPLPAAALTGMTLKIRDGKYEVTVDRAKAADEGTVTLDTRSTPKRMTIKGTSGPNEGKTILAIYEFQDADNLRVCYDLTGQKFPQEFKAPQGSPFYLVDYRRQAAQDAPPR